jgi:N-acetyl-alpha-D-glucosaminyl L-malate synthase BshA
VGNDPNYLETTRYGIEQSDAVTAVSESLRRSTVEKIGVRTPIEVVYNFIDPRRFEVAREHPGARRWAQADERVLVHISNFRPVKRVLDVVRIFERVHAALPSRLLLVGDGPELPRVEQFCRDEGICDAVTFIGNLAPVEETLVGADLFLLPSDTESFGLAALEALSCEVPVIATRVGGLPEVVREGECGHLLPVGDVDGMAAAAIGLLRDPERRRAFGLAGRRRAVEEFSQATILARYRELYGRLVQQPATATAS